VALQKNRLKITKGTSQAVLHSVLIHAGLFLLAGTLVVFTVIKQKLASIPGALG
jgi:hypothetical protein